MTAVLLHEFIGTHRDELIARCKAKVATRSASTPALGATEHGVPLFLDQLVGELRDGPSRAQEMAIGARDHGRELLRRGFTVSEVVHDYGDVCQSVTDLAVEMGASIGIADFRTLNRCLDDAIAGAVTQHVQGHAGNRAGEDDVLRTMLESAIAAFDVLEAGHVGVGGSTGAILRHSLTGMRTFLDRKSPGGPIN
jgi:hypothetical protein